MGRSVNDAIRALANVPARPAQGRLMFTGLIETVGRLAAREMCGGDARLTFDVGTLGFDDVQLGESIAVNGVCLTVVAFDKHSFQADLSNETLSLTTLGGLPVGAALNLERAMRASDRLGGHMVSGHVDGIGSVLQITRCCATSRRKVRSASMVSASRSMPSVKRSLKLHWYRTPSRIRHLHKPRSAIP
jgi:riboflavin synthase alpha subunit